MTLSNSIQDDQLTISELKNEVQNFINERQWSNYHTPKNLAISISIEAAELLELFQWDDSCFGQLPSLDETTRGAIEDEMSDVLAYLLSLASKLNIDLSRAFLKKMGDNRQKYPADDNIYTNQLKERNPR